MKDKEKQIEEMAKVINNSMLNYCRELAKCREVCQYSGKSCRQYTCRDYAYAETLHNEGYRKGKRFEYILEDSVVLSREEYEEYKKVADGKAIMVENITDLNKLVQFPVEYDNKKFEDISEFADYVQEQASKETVMEIINFIEGLKVPEDGRHEWRDRHNETIEKIILKLNQKFVNGVEEV